MRSRTSVRGRLLPLGIIAALLTAPPFASAQSRGIPPIVGRWDLRVLDAGGVRPSWLEISLSGPRTLVGRFVGPLGSVRPISRVEFDRNILRFSIPPQWERESADLRVEGRIENGLLSGTLRTPAGATHSWTATRAPTLRRLKGVEWGDSIVLFNRADLTGWTANGGESHWRVIDGVLTNRASGANLVSVSRFHDFKLHVEFRYAKNANSGIYLRGRYEVQIEDTPPQPEPTPLDVGSIYGFLAPVEEAARPAGEWQTFDITLIGRRVTVVFNGRTVIADQVIPGIAGGALDSDEAEAGPIMLQGDHGPIEFRQVVIIPAR